MIRLTRAELEAIGDVVADTTALLARFEAESRKAVVPNMPVDIVDWCHANLYVPSEATERPGPLRLNKLQQGIARAMQEEGAEWITFQKPPRFGASLFACAIILYFACHEAVDTLYVERGDDQAECVHQKFLSRILTAVAGKVAHLKRVPAKGENQDTWNNTGRGNGASIQLRGALNRIRRPRRWAQNSACSGGCSVPWVPTTAPMIATVRQSREQACAYGHVNALAHSVVDLVCLSR